MGTWKDEARSALLVVLPIPWFGSCVLIWGYRESVIWFNSMYISRALFRYIIFHCVSPRQPGLQPRTGDNTTAPTSLTNHASRLRKHKVILQRPPRPGIPLPSHKPHHQLPLNRKHRVVA